MFVHIVLWNFKNAENRDEEFKIARDKLYNLKNIIPELKSIEFGLAKPASNELERDVALITKFDDVEGYNVYKNHSDHLKVKDYLVTIFKDRVVSDVIL